MNALGDTTTVEFFVVSVERLRAGPVLALVIVDIVIAGVTIRLQGVRVTQRHGGAVDCSAPSFRHPLTGQQLPGVVLPPELSAAVAREVLGAVAEVA